MNNRRIILINGDRIYVNPEVFYSLAQTSFPSGSISFSVHKNIYLEVELLFLEGKAIMEVTDYFPREISSFLNRQQLRTAIDIIEFKNLNWTEISRLASSYQKSRLLPFLDPATISKSNDINKSHSNAPINSSITVRDNELPKEFAYKIKYKDAVFCDGYVVAQRKVDWSPGTYAFKIPNTFLLKEFDAIKLYFGKRINGRDYFVISGLITYDRIQGTQVDAVSEEIAQIDQSLLETIRHDRIIDIAFNGKGNLDIDGTFDTAEFNTIINCGPNGETSIDTGEILKVVCESERVRNKEHLEYLSLFKHQVIQNIRYTGKPSFGFIFDVSGAEYRHFCWELLDKNATYIWSVPNEIYKQFDRIDLIIKTVQQIGRKQYRTQFLQKRIDHDIIFNFIKHIGINDTSSNNLEQWKIALNNIVSR